MFVINALLSLIYKMTSLRVFVNLTQFKALQNT